MRLLLLLPLFIIVHAHTRVSLEDYTNSCLDSRNQKSAPGREDTLYQTCEPWKERSCCNQTISKQIHTSKSWFNLRWDHCKPLSDKCRRHFLLDLCFYECSPNLGSWIRSLNMSAVDIRERVTDAPLCQSECNSWWNDCKEDLTCVKNWETDFEFSTGTNTCPINAPCKPIREMYANATEFCENVVSHVYKVVPDTEQCIQLTFKGDNPNDEVALWKARSILGINHAPTIFSVFTKTFTIIAVMVTVVVSY